ncbi:hypothetical protein [uncultured Thiocystis sp.]|jgi:hypothetical protein|uniref:hypothetical protein n=1 Tax=uncultured Thiocystis sp. TaxID=1202134 RepID=UPI0025F65424|nr:hypothetical protein [uncultured Thiocystis sp.]
MFLIELLTDQLDVGFHGFRQDQLYRRQRDVLSMFFTYAEAYWLNKDRETNDGQFLSARLKDLENDANRLLAAGVRPLQSPDVAIRLAELEVERKALADRIDVDDEVGNSLVLAWKAKGQEIKQLRSNSAGGLSPELYGSVFVDAERWSASIDNAEQAGTELTDRIASLNGARGAIQATLSRLIAEVDKLIDQCMAPEVDESEWRQREQDLEQHILKESRVRQALAACQARCVELLDVLLSSGSHQDQQSDVRVLLAQQIALCEREALDLRQQIGGQQAVQKVWGPLLQDWVTDLLRPGSHQADWDHFKEIYVPQCNVVAITCGKWSFNQRAVSPPFLPGDGAGARHGAPGGARRCGGTGDGKGCGNRAAGAKHRA